jgi:hypothetical protein
MSNDCLAKIAIGNFGMADLMGLAREVDQLRRKVAALEAEVETLKAAVQPEAAAAWFRISTLCEADTEALKAAEGDGR